MRRCLRSLGRVAQQPQRRHWSEEFRTIAQESELDLHLGNVPYYEGHPLVAVLFGWPGATAESMRPYSEMYDRMGMPCVMLAPTWRECCVDDAADIRVMRLFAELQVELCNLRTELVLHFFSSTFLHFLGPCVYLGRRVTKGFVFDSCPTPRLEDHHEWYNADRVAAATKLLSEQGLIEKPGKLRQFYLTARTWWRDMNEGFRMRAREKTSLEMMFAPQLYLKSEHDPLMPAREFAEVLEHQRERKNMKVWEVVWPGNRHMGHLEAEPEEYENVLRDFIHNIIPTKVEQLEVGRNAGAEWPPAIPTDEEQRYAYKWSRPYISKYYDSEVAREKVMEEKRLTALSERVALPDGATQYRYPDGQVRDVPPPLEETAEYIKETTPEFPPGVMDLRDRSHKQRTPENTEVPRHSLLPTNYKVVHRDLNVR